MTRYTYYLIFVNMIAIITTPVPRILLKNAKDGAILSMLTGIVTGLLFIYILIKFFSQFPKQSLPELLASYTPSWFRIPVTLYFAVLWFLAGATTVVMIVFLLITFVTPETSIFTITLSVLAAVYFGVVLKSRNVLFLIELVMLLMLPLGVLMLLKVFSSSELEWIQVRLSLMHVNASPKFSAATATFFAFIGISNIIIFNRYMKVPQYMKKKALLFIAAGGVIMLSTSYFIPIGLLGFDEIDHFIFPWTSAADSVRMKYGLVERVIYVFMLLFIMVGFLSIIIHWHVSYKLFVSVYRFNFIQSRPEVWTPFAFVTIFSALTTWITVKFTQQELYQYTEYYYNITPIYIAVFFAAILMIKKGAAS